MTELKDMPGEIWAYENYGETGRGTWYDEDVTGPHTKKGDVIKFLRADLAERGWRTIESAPRDGREILVYWPYWNANHSVVAKFSGSSGGWEGEACISEFHESVFPERNPTHWQALPQPPKDEADDG